MITIKASTQRGLLFMLTLVLALAIATTGILPAGAATENEGLGLEISPPIKELAADPGQAVTFGIQLRNITKQELLVNNQINNFKAKDETGDPGIIFNDQGTDRYSLKAWIDPVPSKLIKPQEISELPITIRIPANAEPGGHYAVIRFSADPSDSEGQGVAFGASVGTLVLLRVNGKIDESMSVASFDVGQGGRTRKFFEKGPFTFTERLNNTGTVHQRPTGYIDIFTLRGQRVATVPVNNNPVGSVLPASIRKFEQTYGRDKADRPLRFGRFRADLNLIYGSDNTALKSTIYFWVIPYKQIALILLAILVIAIAFRTWLKRYARQVEKRADRRKG
jgi:hypothetical protein